MGREETSSRQELLKQLEAMKNEEKRFLNELQKYKDSDPEVLDKKRKEIEVRSSLL